jgi:hypothetical protein
VLGVVVLAFAGLLCSSRSTSFRSTRWLDLRDRLKLDWMLTRAELQ